MYPVDRSCPLDRWFIQWITLSNVLNNRALMKVILSVPDEGYSWNTSCVLNYISTLLLELYLFRICQVTFHFYTFNIYFNKLKSEAPWSLYRSSGFQLNINIFWSYRFSQLVRMYLYLRTKHYTKLPYDLILFDDPSAYLNVNE